MRNAFTLIGYLAVTVSLIIVGSVLLVEGRNRLRRLFDVTRVHAAAARFADQDPYNPPEFQRPPVEPPHRPNHPACPICHGISARAVQAWPALVAQLEGEQA